MKSRFIFLIVLLFYSKVSKAGVGDPSIQGVCRITLLNNKVLEGFIKVGTGGYYGLWMNGFSIRKNIESKPYDIPKFFDLDFRAIEISDSSFKLATVNDIRSNRLSNGSFKIYFLQWKENTSIYSPINKISNDDSLVIIKHIERHYLLLDSIKLYLDITSTTYLDTIDINQNPVKKISTLNIPISEIIKFELLTKPSKLWLDKIDKANKSYPGCETGDCLPASWFHEMIEDSTIYNLYQPRILYWLDETLR